MTAPYAGFQLYTRHGSALCHTSRGGVWTQRLNFSDQHLYPTQQAQSPPRPDAHCGSIGHRTRQRERSRDGRHPAGPSVYLAVPDL
jgi:hypothetical protein